MKGLLVFVLMNYSMICFGQETLTKVVSFQGVDRSYLMYVPASYSADVPAPLVFNFHGYGSSALDQMRYGDFRYVADTAGFIIVHPQGSIHEGVTHWNVGSWVAGSTADDVGFTEAMIDEVSSEYNIDSRKIYSTGMSNGGYMSFLLACQLSDKIAAIASVTGSMTPNNLLNCNPQRPVPVMQIHGTNDGTVPYTGAVWTEPISDVLDYWKSENNCMAEPMILELPDVNTLDGSAATFYRYAEGDEGSVVEHIKIDGGGHTWPGTAFITPGTNLDFLASDAIWKFFLRYDIEGLVTDVEASFAVDGSLSVHYAKESAVLNVFADLTAIQDYVIYDQKGSVVSSGRFDFSSKAISDLYLQAGTYILSVGSLSAKFIVQH